MPMSDTAGHMGMQDRNNVNIGETEHAYLKSVREILPSIKWVPTSSLAFMTSTQIFCVATLSLYQTKGPNTWEVYRLLDSCRNARVVSPFPVSFWPVSITLAALRVPVQRKLKFWGSTICTRD